MSRNSTAWQPLGTTIFKQALAAAVLTLAIALAGADTPAKAEELADVFDKHAPGSNVAVDHSAWDKLLKTYIKPSDDLNSVDYKAWKAGGSKALKAYVTSLEAVDVAALDRNEQFAYWANLYNAKTIDIVLDAYPVKSIKKISLGGSLLSTFTGGPWDAEVVTVAGESLTLNNIEHDIMRVIFDDPRVHYAVNCASIGCPNLGTEAFTGEKLETQLDAGAKAYVNSQRGVSFNGDDVVASKIYKWFDEDFGGNEAGVIAHLRKYADGNTAAKLAKADDIDDYVYDWDLNDVAR